MKLDPLQSNELDSLHKQIAQLEAQLLESNAACAAMREVLLGITIMPYPEEDDDFTTIVAKCKQALSTDADKAMLERLQGL